MSSLAELNLPLAWFAFVFGLLVGSFLNVVIHRVPRGESVVSPGSHCPACGAPVRPRDNVPLISYALLGGRCRRCRASISPLYPAVELVTGLLFLGVALTEGPTPAALVGMWFAAVIVALIFIDARHYLLPDVIIYPAFVLALAARVWVPLPAPAEEDFVPWRAALVGALILAGAAPLFRALEVLDVILFNKYFESAEEEVTPPRPGRVIEVTMGLGAALGAAWVALVIFKPDAAAYGGLLGAGAGALAGGGLVWMIRALYFYARGVEGMGLGDVKLMAVIGAFLGWSGAVLTIFLAAPLGLIIGLALAWRRREGLRTAVPFGVCLGVAALALMLITQR